MSRGVTSAGSGTPGTAGATSQGAPAEVAEVKRRNPPGATRRMLIAVLIVIAVLAAVVALSVSGAREHRRPATSLPFRSGSSTSATPS